MNPDYGMIIWTVLILVFIFWLIRLLIRKSKKNTPDSLVLFFLSSLILFGCEKTNELDKGKKLINELEVKGAVVAKKSIASSISFDNIAEAKAYIKRFQPSEAIVKGNIKRRKELKPHINIDFVKKWIRDNDLNKRDLISIKSDYGSEDPGGGEYGDLSEWYNAYDSEDPEYSQNSSPCDHGTPALNRWTLFSGRQVSFTYDKGPTGVYNVSQLSSSLIGLHLGVSWTHVNGSTTQSNGMIHFTINGLQHYNIIIEGIGTIFTQPVKISGSFNPCTGAYTMKVE